MTYNPIPGFNSMPEYLISAVPWLTSSIASDIIRHRFDHVMKTFTIVTGAGSGSVSLAFTENGFGSGNCFNIPESSTFSADVRATELWLSGSGASYSLFVGLTAIPSKNAPRMTGSLGFSGVG